MEGITMLLKAKTLFISMICTLSLILANNIYANDQHYFDIFDAINNANEDVALELLERHQATIRQNPNRHIRGGEEDRRALIHFAAEHNRPRVIARLIEYGANPNQEDADGITPAHLAESFGNREALEALNRPNTVTFAQLHQQAQQGLRNRGGLMGYLASWLPGGVNVGSN